MKIGKIFDVNYGNSPGVKKYETGNIPYVSSGSRNNGVFSLVNTDEELFPKYSITVAAKGSIGSCFVQPSPFIASQDNTLVLIEKKGNSVSIEEKYCIAAYINSLKWRYSYGRTLSKTRVENIELNISFNEIAKHFNYRKQCQELLPNENIALKLNKIPYKYKSFDINKLFYIDREYAPYINELRSDGGDVPYISTSEFDNGIVMRCDSEPIFNKYAVTVSLDGKCGMTFFQFEDFIAGEKTAVLTPKFDFNISLIFYLMVIIRKKAWRYSYGRKLSMTRLKKFELPIPINEKGEIDLYFIEKLVKGSYGWDVIDSQLNKKN